MQITSQPSRLHFTRCPTRRATPVLMPARTPPCARTAACTPPPLFQQAPTPAQTRAKMSARGAPGGGGSEAVARFGDMDATRGRTLSAATRCQFQEPLQPPTSRLAKLGACAPAGAENCLRRVFGCVAEGGGAGGGRKAARGGERRMWAACGAPSVRALKRTAHDRSHLSMPAPKPSTAPTHTHNQRMAVQCNAHTP